MKVLTISAVAQRSGLPASALRYYEEKGLIASVGRSGLKRTFDVQVLERLSFIALGRSAGFSLDEIREMLASGRKGLDRSKLSARADAIDAQMKRLTALRDGLRHAAACPAPSHFECPTFQRLLQRATRTRASKRPHARTDA